MDTLLNSAAVVSLLGVLATYLFSEHGKKKRLISRTLADIAASCRAYRDFYIRMAEYDIDFRDQEKNTAEALRQKRETIVAEVHKEAAFNSQKRAFMYQELFSVEQRKLTRNIFVLTALLPRQIKKYSFQKELNGLLKYVLMDRSSFEKAKAEIDDNLIPHLSKIEGWCMDLLREQNYPISTKISINMKRFFSSKKTTGVK